MSQAIIRACRFAEQWHRGHERQWVGGPYLIHLLEVGEILASHHAPNSVVIAGILHDSVEDTKTTLDIVRDEFGPIIAQMVHGMTDVYTKKAYPTWNRAVRKEAEVDRLANESGDVQSIKCADIISNTSTIVSHNPQFSTTYLPEMAKLIVRLDKAYPLLWEFTKQVHDRAVADYRKYWDEHQPV